MEQFHRIKRLPPYVFSIVNDLKTKARWAGEDIIDLGMGNPDQATPGYIVEKLCEAAQNPRNHRYSASRGIPKLRLAICNWYKRNFGVKLDCETEAIATIGAKEGLSHLAMAIVGPGDVAFAPNPTYPIHTYSLILAGGNLRTIPLIDGSDFLSNLESAIKLTWPRPKLLMLSFPHNPTTSVVDIAFFEQVVALAREYELYIIHDFAYADIVFDGYRAPSILQVEGAKDVCLEFFSLSKSYNMPGWRVGFAVGNPTLISALSRIKSYLDYGIFQPIQIASIIALNGPRDAVDEIVAMYKNRRDVLCRNLNRIGWEVTPPKATMFVWAKIPGKYQEMGSVEFCKFLIKEAKVAVSPGIGFGELGDKYVRFALVENEDRIRQAVRGIKGVL
jgi:alanine-synthesizing transaminase